MRNKEQITTHRFIDNIRFTQMKSISNLRKIMQKIFKLFLAFLFAISMLQSCKDDSSHPITWEFWTDAAKTKILKFNSSGSVYDLYDYSNTQADRFEIGEALLTMNTRRGDFQETIKAEVLSAKNGVLIIKYSDKRIDTLTRAKVQDCIIGNWIPTQQETNLDSFEINTVTRDCIRRDTSKLLKRFRYNILTDSTVVFDYFEMNRKDTLKYFISSDRLLLMLKKKDYIVSLRRI